MEHDHMASSGRGHFLQGMRKFAEAADDQVSIVLGLLLKFEGQQLSPEHVVEALNSSAPGLGPFVTQFLLYSIEVVDHEKLIEDFVSILASENFPPPILERFRLRLRELLSTGISEGFASFALQGEYERLYESGSVFTDVRPVYTGTATSIEIKHHLVVHQLKLKYQQLGGTREIYVAMSSKELKNLVHEIDLAIRRADMLRARLSNTLGKERGTDSDSSI